MAQPRVYPDDLNPFGSEDEASEQERASAKASTGDTNPFGSSDDEDTHSSIKSPSHSISLPYSPDMSSARTGHAVNAPENGLDNDRSSGDLSLLKPPVAPRRRSTNEPLKNQNKLDINLLPRRSSSSHSNESQPSSIPTTPTSRVKRRAPPVPEKEAPADSLSVLSQPSSIAAQNGYNGVRKIKKQAPRPPGSLAKNDVGNLKSSIGNLSLSSDPPVLSSGETSLVSSPALPKRHSALKNPVTPEHGNDHTPSSELPGVLDDVEEQKLMEQLRELVNEHRLIQAELRQLIEMPDERRTEAHLVREEQLMKDLVENVKRREELEYEEETCEVHDATTGEKTVKKMKKKRKFRLKKLLRGL